MHLFISFLLTAGMVVTLIILWVLIRTEKRALPHNILIVIFFFLFFVSFNGYGQLHEIDWIYALGYLFADTIGFAVGPLLYLYIKSLYQTPSDFLKKHLIHFVPFFIYLVGYSLPSLYLYWSGEFIFEYVRIIERYPFLLHIQGVYLFVYCFASLKVLNQTKKIIKQNYSNLVEKDLNWIRYLAIGIMIVVGVDLISLAFDYLTSSVELGSDYLPTFVMIGVILYLGHYGTSQSRILLPAHLLVQTELPVIDKPNPTEAAHHLSNTSQEDIEQLSKRLTEVLEQERPFLEEDLTLNALAQRIPTTDKKLSALLNQVLNISFYDLINDYRVQAVKAKLADPDFAHFTLLAIAFECGFNSKTSFNRVFKKATGLSPSAYRKQM